MKVLTVLGARPQFVKAAVVSREMRRHGDICEIIVHTGQHFDKKMSDVFFEEMDIPLPNYNLNINRMSHGEMTGEMLKEIEGLLYKEKPDLLVTYGDTNSTLAGGMAASKLHIPVAHIEAGLRSFNMKMPEEVNRVLVDRMSRYLFCPTEDAVNNLKMEGYEKFKDVDIILSGDVMYDAALAYSKKSRNYSKIINNLGLGNNGFVLATLHRAENVDDNKKLIEICRALNEVNSITKVVIPLHPRTHNKIKELNLKLNCKVIEPVGYFDMLELLQNCEIVMTDSGGLQKEAYFFSKYCITLRDQTEWGELIQNGFNQLVGADREKIVSSYKTFRNKNGDFSNLLYGNGNASRIIIEKLRKHL